MSAPQALAHWPGVDQIESFSGTLGHGITPSIFRLTIAPQQGIVPQRGNLTLSFGGQNVVTFADCIIDSATYTYNESGYLVSFQIMDRRWKWRYGTISGAYNLRNEDGEIRAGTQGQNLGGAVNGGTSASINTERTPQQLAKLCLEAMGEEGFDVSSLPDEKELRPGINWDDNITPAEALQKLCEPFACRVVLTLDNRVRIVRLGQGNPLPSGPIISDQYAADPPERPDHIVIATPIKHQYDFPLEAVGLDLDGKIKPIDKLSYTPAGGWKTFPPSKLVETAKATRIPYDTVFHWYRIKVGSPVRDEKIKIPVDKNDFKEIATLEDILPLHKHQVEVAGDGKPLEPAIYGIWLYEAAGVMRNSTDKVEPLTRDTARQLCLIKRKIDMERGIVMFESPVYRNDPPAGALQPAEAKLRLRIAASIRDPKTGQFRRYHHKVQQPGPVLNTPPLVIRHDEIEAATVTTYGADGIAGVALSFASANTDGVNKKVKDECEYYIKKEGEKFQLKEPQVRTYAGILPIDPDGALQSIEWTIGGSGGFTKVARNQDLGSVATPPYALRRFFEKVGALVKAEDVKVK